MTYFEYALNIIPMAILLSFSHCIGMCGGFIMAYNIKLANKSKFHALIYSLSYHISRIFAYVCLGFFAGIVGKIIGFSFKAQGYMHFCIGILLVVFGVAFIKRGELLKIIENDKIWNILFAKRIKSAMQSNSYTGFITLGFLNGLLPCGVVYTFLAMSIMSGDIVKGVFIMFLFGISTLPSMLSFSFVVNLLSLKFKNTMLFLSAVSIIIFGLYNSYLGFMALQ